MLASLNLGGLVPGLLKSTFYTKNFICRLSGLSPAISLKFSVEMCAASKNCKKSRSFKVIMLINLKSLSPVLVMISSMSVPICNRFHTIRANNSKKKHLFRGYSSLTPSFEKNPCTQGHKILSQKTRDLAAAHGKNFVILACTVLTQYSSVTDGWTDRQTPRPWLRRMKHSAITRKNNTLSYLIS